MAQEGIVLQNWEGITICYIAFVQGATTPSGTQTESIKYCMMTWRNSIASCRILII